MAFEPELATTLWSASNVWMEFSNQTKPASVSSILSYELGENLRSNAVGARGGDNYAFMRELNAGDPVIHLVKTKGISWKIVGISFVKHRHVKRIGANGKYFYFIKLKYFVDFRKTSDCVSLNDIVSLYKKEIRQDAIENKSFFYPFILRKGVIVPAQRYISLTSRKLLSFILEILSGDREYEKFVGVDSDIDEIRREARTKGTSATTVNRLIDARLGQGKFRSDLEAEWNDQCAVLGLTTRALLRASHIKPWSQSTDSERLDPANGILLAAHIDALFDRGLISFNDDGEMIVSPALEKSEQKILRLDGCRLNKIPSIKMKRYLAYHRDKLGHQEGEFEKIGVQRLLHDQRQPVKARRMSVWPVASQTRHS